jgi:hypothetical protein
VQGAATVSSNAYPQERAVARSGGVGNVAHAEPLENVREKAPTGHVVSVESHQLAAVQRCQQLLQSYVDAYLYSAELLDSWAELRDATVVDWQQESDFEYWWDYWANVAVKLDNALGTIKVLVRSRLFTDGVGTFADRVKRLEQRVTDASGTCREAQDKLDDHSAVDWSVYVQQLGDQLYNLDTAIKQINVDCRDKAKEQIKKLAQTVDRIFKRMEVSRNVARSDDNRRSLEPVAAHSVDARSAAPRGAAPQVLSSHDSVGKFADPAAQLPAASGPSPDLTKRFFGSRQ